MNQLAFLGTDSQLRFHYFQAEIKKFLKMIADYFIFEDYRNRNNPFYKWFLYLIHLPYEKDVLLDKSQSIVSNLEETLAAREVLFHEYVHYRQNMFTLYGAMVLSNHLATLIQISISNLIKKENENINSEYNYEDAVHLGKIGLELRNKTIKDLTRKDRSEVVLAESINYQLVTEHQGSEDHVAVLLYRKRKIYLGNTSIWESMATIMAWSFRYKTDEEIYKKFINHRTLSPDNDNSNGCYWALFFGFYSNKKLSQVAEGIVYLCDILHDYINPAEALARFVDYYNEIKAKGNLKELVYSWIKSVSETNLRSHSRKEIKKSISLIKEKTRNQHRNTLLQDSNTLIEYLQTNLDRRDERRSFNYYDQKFWAEEIEKTGIFCVRFRDSVDKIGTMARNEKVSTAYLRIISCEIAYILSKRISNRYCPFFAEIDICKSKHKSDDVCQHDPFLITVEDEEGCLFSAGMRMMGLD